MLQIGAQTKIYITTFAIDFREGMDGLCAMIKSQFNLDPMTGALFAFTNNRKSGIKFIIYVVPSVARNLLLLIYNGDPFKFKFQKNWKEFKKNTEENKD